MSDEENLINKPPVLKKSKEKKIETDIQETQNILNQIEQDSKELEKNLKNKKVKFEDQTETKSTPINEIKKNDDEKSELSDGSDLELDLESFEKSLLED